MCLFRNYTFLVPFPSKDGKLFCPSNSAHVRCIYVTITPAGRHGSPHCLWPLARLSLKHVFWQHSVKSTVGPDILWDKKNFNLKTLYIHGFYCWLLYATRVNTVRAALWRFLQHFAAVSRNSLDLCIIQYFDHSFRRCLYMSVSWIAWKPPYCPVEWSLV